MAAPRCNPGVHHLLKCLTSRADCEIDQRISRDEAHQGLGLAVRDARLEPNVELPDVGLEGDAAQPPEQAEVVQSQRGQEIAIYYEEGDWDPAGVRMDLVRHQIRGKEEKQLVKRS